MYNYLVGEPVYYTLYLIARNWSLACQRSEYYNIVIVWYFMHAFRLIVLVDQFRRVYSHTIFFDKCSVYQKKNLIRQTISTVFFGLTFFFHLLLCYIIYRPIYYYNIRFISLHAIERCGESSRVLLCLLCYAKPCDFPSHTTLHQHTHTHTATSLTCNYHINNVYVL